MSKQYANYKNVDYPAIIPFIKKYFTPSKKIKTIRNNLLVKYNMLGGKKREWYRSYSTEYSRYFYWDKDSNVSVWEEPSSSDIIIDYESQKIISKEKTFCTSSKKIIS